MIATNSTFTKMLKHIKYKSQLGSKFFRRYLFWCLHFETSSDLLFNNFSLSLCWLMRSFSVRHRLHDLDTTLYPFVLLNVDHSISWAMFSSLSFQIYWDSLESLTYFLFLNAFLWFRSRTQNGGSLTPMYSMSRSLLLGTMTFVRYTLFWMRQFHLKGK